MGYEANKRWRLKNTKQRGAAKTRNYTRGSSGRRRPWTHEENKLVLAHEQSDRALSFMIDRSIRAIQIQRCRLKGD